MSEYASFDHFARDLMLFSSHFPRNNQLVEPVSFMEDASFISDYFADGHNEEFWLLFGKAEYQDLQTEEQFFKYAIPRCLNLIDKERYFYSLMLIAGFLQEFLFYLTAVRKCHRFHFTAYKCLLAVFKRSFEDSFKVNGGFKGLKKYMKGILKKLYCSEHKYIIDTLNQGNRHLRDRVLKLIENCDDFSDESFNLNEYEISLIRDDDIKHIMELLDSDEVCEDPLDLKWPPSKEEMQEVLESYRIRMSNLKRPSYISTGLVDSCSDSESDSDESDNSFYKPQFSDLHLYMMEIVDQAEKRYDDIKIFYEKMELRKCPCCGIQCYQFSHNLYLKQLDSALIQRVPKWKSCLQKFISFARFKMSGCFN